MTKTTIVRYHLSGICNDGTTWSQTWTDTRDDANALRLFTERVDQGLDPDDSWHHPLIAGAVFCDGEQLLTFPAPALTSDTVLQAFVVSMSWSDQMLAQRIRKEGCGSDELLVANDRLSERYNAMQRVLLPHISDLRNPDGSYMVDDPNNPLHPCSLGDLL